MKWTKASRRMKTKGGQSSRIPGYCMVSKYGVMKVRRSGEIIVFTYFEQYSTLKRSDTKKPDDGVA